MRNHDQFGQVSRESSNVDLLPYQDKRENFILRNCYVQVCLILFHALLCLANLVFLGLASTFDTLCAVKQAKSIVNCTEKVLIKAPQPFVMVFFLTTITNAIAVMTTLCLKPAGVEFCGFKQALKQLIRKGSFWSFNVTYIFVVLDYILVTFQNLEIANKALAIILVVFFASKLTVAYFLNYVFPVKFPERNERNLTRVYIWLAYWITLVLFFLASAHSSLAITLDVAEKLSPLGKVQTGSHNFVTVSHLVLLGIKATFEGRLFLFYWNKIFHGDKDLFSTFIVLKSIQEQPMSSINSDQGRV